MSATVDDQVDEILRLHEGGKLEVRATVPLRDRADLARVYTPGFTTVAGRIATRPDLVDRWSLRSHTVAVVTDGTSVSGLGDLGPRAALPVMEGKALLFKRFVGLDAFPICLATTDVDEIVRIVTCLEPTFGAIMLEDISAPRCFTIEERLRQNLSIPVLHDDQHATAVAATAALINAARFVGKQLSDLKVVISGVGAAGTATARLFTRIGVADVVVCDRQGAITAHRAGLEEAKRWLAANTNPHQEQGDLRKILVGADVFVGFSGPGVIRPEDLRTMARDPIVFALANPVPELHPDDVRGLAAVIGTGRSDLPNQIDCGLCYPGLFLGALQCGALAITEEMKVEAARAIAGQVTDEALARGVIVPDIFDDVAPPVAAAVVRVHEKFTSRKEMPR